MVVLLALIVAASLGAVAILRTIRTATNPQVS